MGFGVKGFMGLFVCGFMDSWVLELKMGMLTPRNEESNGTSYEKMNMEIGTAWVGVRGLGLMGLVDFKFWIETILRSGCRIWGLAWKM